MHEFASQIRIGSWAFAVNGDWQLACTLSVRYTSPCIRLKAAGRRGVESPSPTQNVRGFEVIGGQIGHVVELGFSRS